MKIKTPFKLEAHLVADFKNKLCEPQNPFAVSKMAPEFYYQNGRVDIIGHTIDGDLIAFEAKLLRWNVALNQAYRSSSFAHYSYVVLPEATTQNALKSEYEFIRRGIGLCSFGQSGIRVEIPAMKKKPLQPWLTNSAVKYIKGEKNGEQNPFAP